MLKTELEKKAKLMTYVLGVQCKDGVVVIADRKVSGEKVKKPYTAKIKTVPQFEQLIFTAAGVVELFKEFLLELPLRVTQKIDNIKKYNTSNPESSRKPYDLTDFKHECVLLLKDMYGVYSNSSIIPQDDRALQVLFVLKEPEGNTVKSNLYYLGWGTKFPTPVEKYQAIGQPHLGETFLKCYDDEITTNEAIRLGCFIIKYIEEEKLSKNDGVGIGKYYPQIFICPDGNELFRELKGEEIEKIYDGTNEKVEKVRKLIGSLSTSLRS